MDNLRVVPMGEMVVSDAPGDVLVAYGLGSCVTVCLYDPVAQVGGMLHALLPSPNGNGCQGKPAKFADQGVVQLLNALLRSGARRSRLVASLCGGARMLSAPGFNGLLAIGEQNVRSAKATLRAAGLRIQAQDTGGRAGRTVRLYVATGQVTVKTLKQGERTLNTKRHHTTDNT